MAAKQSENILHRSAQQGFFSVKAAGNAEGGEKGEKKTECASAFAAVDLTGVKFCFFYKKALVCKNYISACGFKAAVCHKGICRGIFT